MAFVTSLDSSSEKNRRDSERRVMNAVFGAVTGRGAPFTVVVHDISETGFRAEFASEFHVGDEVRLRLGSAGYTSAEVMWREGWFHGCRFLEPISPAQVQEAFETLIAVVERDEVGKGEPQGEESVVEILPAKPRRGQRRLLLMIVAVFVVFEAYILLKMLF